jgi:hypothetical protein
MPVNLWILLFFYSPPASQDGFISGAKSSAILLGWN